MGTLKLSHGGEIYYEFIPGEPGEPYLLFLHEGLGSTAMWKKFPGMLCKETGYPGLLYDRLGHGRSSALMAPRRINYLHEHALFELPEVIGQLIPQQRFFLIGHSDGGSISLIHASQKPDLLMGIISEAAHVFVDSKTLQGIRATAHDFQAGELNGLFKYHGEKTTDVFNAWHRTWLSDWFKSWNIEYVLPSIECPGLVVQGTQDPYGTTAQVRAIASGVSAPVQIEMIAGCGHTPHHESQEQVVSLISEFIKQTMRPVSDRL